MRTLFYASICLIILGTAWVLYLESTNKAFVENLPKSPIVHQSPAPPDAPPKTEGKTFVQNTPDTAPGENESLEHLPVPEARPLQKLSKHSPAPSHSHDETYTAEINQEPVNWERTKTPPMKLDRETLREGLIATHGNIPEIDIFLRHFPTDDMEAGMSASVKFEGTQDEHLEYRRALATLWPNPGNIQAYEAAKALATWKFGDPIPPGVEFHHIHVDH